MLKVLIAEDSSTIRFILKRILNSDPNITVVGEAEDGEKAVELCKKLKPDIVTMDIRMPKMNGFEATQEIMQFCPTPILVISASVQSEDLNIAFNAIKAGALDIVEKPKGNLSFDFEKIGKRIVQKVKILSEVKVIRQRSSLKRQIQSSASNNDVQREKSLLNNSIPRVEVVAIVCSTGGPKALLSILKDIPANFSVPIVVVQHITPGFGQGLIDWLNAETDLRVKFADQGEKIEAGIVYFAKDDHHIRVTSDGTIDLSHEADVVGLRPYGNYLFDSVAEHFGKRSIGIILTGMGRDGADGLKKMKDNGAVTIGQDKQSSVVYGMPKEAFDIGGISIQLPLEQIAEQIKKLVTH